MSLIDIIGFLTASFFLIRIMLLIKIDSRRKKNPLFKFLFGGYAFEAVIPIIKKSGSEEEANLVKAANICLVVFYLLFGLLLLTVWLTYRNPTYKPAPNENKTYQAKAVITTTYQAIVKRSLS